MNIDCEYDICIVGLGPSGIGAALKLSGSKKLKIIYIDAGLPPQHRNCHALKADFCIKENPCQIINGFGGCSLLGGGKVSLFPAGSKLADILGSNNRAEHKILEALSLFEQYVPLYKPDTKNSLDKVEGYYNKLGFSFKYYDVYQFNLEDLLKAYETIYNELSKSGLLMLNCALVDNEQTEDGFKLTLKQGDNSFSILTKRLIIGVGRYNRNLLLKLNSKLNLGGTVSEIELGVRLEFPVEIFPDINEYHNDLKLIFNNQKSRTFCVCRNGKTIALFSEGIFLTEGQCCLSNKTNFTNLAILTKLNPSEKNFSIVEEIKERSLNLFNGFPCYQNFETYINNSKEDLNNVPKTLSFAKQGNIFNLFPEHVSTEVTTSVYYFVSNLISQKNWNKINMYAPEIDFNGLVFPIKPDFSVIPNFYIIGSSTGTFRGILQSFCSGLICGESILGEIE